MARSYKTRISRISHQIALRNRKTMIALKTHLYQTATVYQGDDYINLPQNHVCHLIAHPEPDRLRQLSQSRVGKHPQLRVLEDSKP